MILFEFWHNLGDRSTCRRGEVQIDRAGASGYDIGNPGGFDLHD